MISFFFYTERGEFIKFLINVIKGIIIGIGKVIPGVSGSILANSLGVYEKGLEILSNVKTKFLKNIKFIVSIGLGIMIAMVFGSKAIVFLLNQYYLITIFCFIGMIIGGIKPDLERCLQKFSKKNLVILLICFFAIILLSVVKFKGNNHSNVLTYFFSGIVEAISTIVPGISGTALLMLIGTYDEVMLIFANLFNWSYMINNLIILLPFLFGLIIGVMIVSKILNYLLKNYKAETNYAIIGFSFASIILLFFQTLEKKYTIVEILISICTLIIGYIVAVKMAE